MTTRTILPAVFIVLLTLPMTLLAATRTSSTERSFPAAPSVAVDASFHQVEITARPGDTIDVEIELEFTASTSKAETLVAEYEPRFEVSDDRLVISSTGKDPIWGWGSARKRGTIRLHVPPGTDMAIDNSSGTVTLDGDFGDSEVSVDNSSGGVRGEGALASLAVDNSSGGTHFRALRPLESFTVDCSSGSVRLEGGARRASVDSSSGSVHLTDLLGPADIDTSSGSVEATWASADPGTAIEVGASSGGVRLTFPVETELAGTVQTSSGGIRTDFPGSLNDRHNHLDLEGGREAVHLDVTTSSGSVKLIAN